MTQFRFVGKRQAPRHPSIMLIMIHDAFSSRLIRFQAFSVHCAFYVGNVRTPTRRNEFGAYYAKRLLHIRKPEEYMHPLKPESLVTQATAFWSVIFEVHM